MFRKLKLGKNFDLDAISSQMSYWILDFEIIMYNTPEHSGDAQFIEK